MIMQKNPYENELSKGNGITSEDGGILFNDSLESRKDTISEEQSFFRKVRESEDNENNESDKVVVFECEECEFTSSVKTRLQMHKCNETYKPRKDMGGKKRSERKAKRSALSPLSAMNDAKSLKSISASTVNIKYAGN